jgi:hypothetical protein
MDQQPLVSFSSARAKYMNLLVTGILTPLEYILDRRSRTSEGPICFIVGPPRSGTTLLYELVVTQFQCGYFTNLAKRLFRVPVAATWLCRNAIGRRRGSFDSVYGELEGRAAPNEAGRIWSHWMPYAAPYFQDKPGLTPERMQRKVAAISRIVGQPMIIKNMILQSDFPLLKKIFPNAIFIYVERDWADNARSLAGARKDKVSMDETGWWSLRPTGWEVYAGAEPVKQSCAQVILSHRALRADLGSLEDTGRVIKVSYERLCLEPGAVLCDIEAFFVRNGVNTIRKPTTAMPEITLRRQPEDETRARIVEYLDKITADTAPQSGREA